jgi:hypothetical protein
METKACQNCKQEFIITVDDFDFYKKMEVPSPTFCSLCRAQRRMSFLNERTLYKRKCDMTGESIVSLFPENSEVPVYSPKAWWSDGWDAIEYGQDYDFSKPFFEQFGQLLRTVPQFSLQSQYTTLVRSDYVNMGTYNKDCYLSFNTSYSEESAYTTFCLHGKKCLDVYKVDTCELCYESQNIHKSSKVFYSYDCADSYDIWFSKHLKGCSNCFGCVNLRNKSYYIFNEPYTKEAYFEKIKKYNLGSHKTIQGLLKKTDDLFVNAPVRFMEANHNSDVSGDQIYHCKNVHQSFEMYGIEDSKYCQFVFYKPAKDCYDMTLWGGGAERIYECMGAGDNENMVKFSFDCWAPGFNIEYSYHIVSPNKNIFGCIGLKNKEYCILNKQYTKEEYEELVPKIKQHMMDMPYVDKKGRVYKYGEFFPTEISLFAYNETFAQSYFPLTKEEIIEKGYRFKDREENVYTVTKKAQDLPDDIKDVDESILSDVIECESSGRAFRLTSAEFQFYKFMNIPIPRLHSDERHKRRLLKQNPMQLWHRKCMNEGCINEFETSYAPDRPEKVFCESCYQKEVL